MGLIEMATYKFRIDNFAYSTDGFYFSNLNNVNVSLSVSGNRKIFNANQTNVLVEWGGIGTISCFLNDERHYNTGNPLFYLSKSSELGAGLCILSYFDETGKFVNYRTKPTGDISQEFTVSDTPSYGLESLSVTADNGIKHILYNKVTYDTFPATIPLDPAATTMQVESKSPVLTINDGGNLKSVTYGSATFTKFPATVTATTPEFALTARGKDSPVITVRTERTQPPVITNT